LKGFNQDILLPFGKAELYQRNLSKNKAPLASWTVVKVSKTDTVEKVAADLDVEADQIRDLNKIPKGMKIRTGSTILIPKNTTHQGNVSTEFAQNPILSLEREFVPVPVVMKCHGKKCVAVPSNLANYGPKGSSTNTKVTPASDKPTAKNSHSSKSSKGQGSNSKSTTSTKAPTANNKVSNKESSTQKSTTTKKKGASSD
jgi:membrane-bound lytic murein transglycosylase D